MTTYNTRSLGYTGATTWATELSTHNRTIPLREANFGIAVIYLGWRPSNKLTTSSRAIGISYLICMIASEGQYRGTQRANSSKPLNIALLNVF